MAAAAVHVGAGWCPDGEALRGTSASFPEGHICKPGILQPDSEGALQALRGHMWKQFLEVEDKKTPGLYDKLVAGVHSKPRRKSMVRPLPNV